MGNWRIYNMDDAALRSRLCSRLNQLRGRYRIEVVKYRPRRSDRQNAYLFGVVYPAIKDGIEEAWGETLTVDEVHLLCKQKFCSKPVVNRETGEILGQKIDSSAAMDTKEFGEYVDHLIKFAGEYFGVEVPQPETDAAEYREKDEA